MTQSLLCAVVIDPKELFPRHSREFSWRPLSPKLGQTPPGVPGPCREQQGQHSLVVFTGGGGAVAVALALPVPLAVAVPLPVPPGARVLPVAAAGAARALVHRGHPGCVGCGDGGVADET